MAKQQRIGGSFAPPLDNAKLIRYRELVAGAEPALQEAMSKLCDMAETFNQTPPSSLRGVSHPLGKQAPTMIPLEQAEIDRIESVVPWDHENEMYALLFDKIDPQEQKELRDAAYHLLWYAKELALDREPLTADRI